MHNTEIENLEFAIQFSTTNLRYLYGEPKPFSERTNELIKLNTEHLNENKEKLANLNAIKRHENHL